jgi:hypothetical protein
VTAKNAQERAAIEAFDAATKGYGLRRKNICKALLQVSESLTWATRITASL